ncbi:MAG TPA: hypothetical protein VGC17_02315 [Lactovum miscens]|uniref:hypothetical protein n=1 Tax=Lactovum miscens TaxID=190387 RepID=UPI002EDB4736
MRGILGMIGGFLAIMMLGLWFFFMQVDNNNSNVTTQAMNTAIQAASIASRNTTSKSETMTQKTAMFKSLNAYMASYFDSVNVNSRPDKQQNRGNTSFDFLLTSEDEIKVIDGIANPVSADLTVPIAVKAVKIHYVDSKGINYVATSALTGASITKINTPFGLNTPNFPVPLGTLGTSLASLEPQYGNLFYDAGNSSLSSSSSIKESSSSDTITTKITNANGGSSNLNQIIPVEAYEPVITSPKQVTIIAGQDILTQASAKQLGPNGTTNLTVVSNAINNSIAGTVLQSLTATNTVTGAITTFVRQLVILPDLAVITVKNASVGTFALGSGIPSISTLLSGVKATLPLEGNANYLITVSTTNVNPNAPGTYTLTYQVISPVSSAFVATTTRTITYQ